MNNGITQQTKFWKFLENNKIEIPIIQRDYAQGRKGKENLRKIFLNDLISALEKNEVLKLDFIYGCVKNGCLNPLDGQQRLTTLWLLHWYIAYKAGKLEIDANIKVFKRFTYETRVSSREFCEKLSEFTEKNCDSIVEYIQNQTWFLAAWKQDPTIEAMLNTLGMLNDILQNIDGYWEKLTETNGQTCPIIFYYLPLHELKLSDDLYIKMNARGKPLTSFENFKADLVGYLEERGFNKDEKNLEKNPQDTIAHKLDTAWTDIFWKYRSKDYEIDDIYFTFLNRYFFSNWITLKREGKYYTVKEIEKDNLFEYLYNKDDRNIKYKGFDIYKSLKCDFNRLEKILDNFHKTFKNVSKDDICKLLKISFIPEYRIEKEKNILTELIQRERVVFHAICRYFETNEYDEKGFKQWLRIVWNIANNSNQESSIEGMLGAIRLIDELAENSHNIYSFLADTDKKIISETAKDQITEEREKAKKILENSIWEDKIINAEQTAFFNGAIRFLFRTERSIYDWDKFDSRLEKAKEYFNSNGVIEIYTKEAILLRTFISNFSEQKHFENITFDNNVNSWRKNLLDETYIDILNQFFDITDIKAASFDLFSSSITEDRLRDLQNDLCKTTILKDFGSNSSWKSWYLIKYGICVLYPSNTKDKKKIFILADKRNQILYDLEKRDIIEIYKEQKIEKLPYFRGWDIFFTLKVNKKKYMYQRWNILKVQNDSGEWEDTGVRSADKIEECILSGKFP
jgi:hypothetical protein